MHPACALRVLGFDIWLACFRRRCALGLRSSLRRVTSTLGVRSACTRRALVLRSACIVFRSAGARVFDAWLRLGVRSSCTRHALKSPALDFDARCALGLRSACTCPALGMRRNSIGLVFDAWLRRSPCARLVLRSACTLSRSACARVFDASLRRYVCARLALGFRLSSAQHALSLARLALVSSTLGFDVLLTLGLRLSLRRSACARHALFLRHLSLGWRLLGFNTRLALA